MNEVFFYLKFDYFHLSGFWRTCFEEKKIIWLKFTKTFRWWLFYKIVIFWLKTEFFVQKLGYIFVLYLWSKTGHVFGYNQLLLYLLRCCFNSLVKTWFYFCQLYFWSVIFWSVIFWYVIFWSVIFLVSYILVCYILVVILQSLYFPQSLKELLLKIRH